MDFKNIIQNGLDTMKDGILNITREMQSSEKVKSIKIRNKFGSRSSIVINGEHTFSTSNCISVNIEGNVETVDTQGSVQCEDVTGNINTQGSVTCGDVGGNIDTQGSVRCGNVEGSINTMGSVNADNVKGDIDTMGRVTINSKG